jgi:hypothetical protein
MIGLKEDLRPIWREDIILEIRDFVTLCVSDREESFHRLTSLVRAFQDGIVRVGDTEIMFSIVHGIQPADTAGIISIANYLLKGDFLCLGI